MKPKVEGKVGYEFRPDLDRVRLSSKKKMKKKLLDSAQIGRAWC